MDHKLKPIEITPIGIVKNTYEKGYLEDYEDKISKIIIEPSYKEGLEHLDENSHIMVVFWLNRVEDKGRGILKLYPKKREDLPLTGVFATRSPRRPNPIGIRAVKLLKITDNVLTVEGLDAFNGTPVLDIKPYSSKHDLVEDAKYPWWVEHLSDK
jgi:tRNA-Thr(GGU) m(6)t(6)A37 methyltransferase TsaA